MTKVRLDIEMVQRGLCPSREKARALILAGEVRVNGMKAEKAGQEIPSDAEITVIEDAIPFVSRGGLKIQKAIESFQLDLTDHVAIDVGASTGGFTDCMLQHGARCVYALDVGYGQLDWRLRNDPRVVVMERTNARNMQPDWFDVQPDFAAMDVAFISIRLILPALHACLKDGSQVVALIKPQFEAGRGKVGKNGVVRDAQTHIEVCTQIVEYSAAHGYHVRGLDVSPIKGPKGNIEFLALLEAGSETECTNLPNYNEVIATLVHEVHNKNT